MDQNLPILGLILVVGLRFLDARELRALDADTRGRIDAALFRSRTIGLAMLVAALVAGGVAYVMKLAVDPTLIVFALVLASVVVQTVLGVLQFREIEVPARYKAVFVATRVGMVAGLALLIAPVVG